MAIDTPFHSLTRRRFLAGLATLPAAAGLAVNAAPGLAAQATPEPVAGGTLRTTLGAEPNTLDPHIGNTLFDRDVADALYDGLIDDDASQGVNGALAESWDSADAINWTFKLRAGATFHDGSPITSEEVKLTIERVQNPATSATGLIKRTVDLITAVETPDPATVKIQLSGPAANFPQMIADVKIVPKNFDPANPIGSGPFRYAEWVRNRYVRVEKYAGYYQTGMPYLDAVVFMPTPDENQKIVLLQTGEVEFTDTVPLPRAQEVEQGGEVLVFTIPKGVSPSSYSMLARCTEPPLDDERVRRAINFAIDRQALLDAVFGYGTIKSNPVPPEHWAFNPDALSYNERDVDQARTLMSEAGQSSGFSLQLKHITSRAEYTTLAQILQANLAEIGITIEIVPQEINVWVEEVLNKHDFQLGLTGIIPAYDPDDILGRFDLKNADGAAMGWENAEYLDLMAQARAIVDLEERKKLYFRVQEILQQAVPGFILNERPILYGAAKSVQGFRPDLRQHTHFGNVWLQQ
ncbi:MAG: peptide/nickel transport system substrate-binding protein [Thermomicrobiales bacterium]|nr:peptide/nickel transport system substrate-binding protein [Thermomicrobiales bacterium]